MSEFLKAYPGITALMGVILGFVLNEVKTLITKKAESRKEFKKNKQLFILSVERFIKKANFSLDIESPVKTTDDTAEYTRKNLAAQNIAKVFLENEEFEEILKKIFDSEWGFYNKEVLTNVQNVIEQVEQFRRRLYQVSSNKQLELENYAIREIYIARNNTIFDILKKDLDIIIKELKKIK